MARGAGASGWGGGSGAGGAKGRRKQYEIAEKPFSASELNITGTQKQVTYARDIVQGMFDSIDANIKRSSDFAKKATTKGGKTLYENEASQWREFKADMTKTYRQNAKTELKASQVIDFKAGFNPVTNFNEWKRMKGKK